MTTILKRSKEKIKYVVHMADIHIHKRDRETEYRHVFDNLIKDFKKCKLDHKNSVIVVAGDIIHDKTDLHPVSVALTRDFFIMLAEITDVICICGNHDTLSHNMTYNSLESIIGKGLKTTHGVFLLLKNALYEYANIIFGHTSIDATEITKCSIETNKYKCCLYHGSIANENIDIPASFQFHVDDFSDWDFVFLGDIHKHSFLKPNIAYPGSLIQQTFDESLNKGYILWDLPNKSGKFRRIHNDYGKLKFTIGEDGADNFQLGKKLPKFAEIDISCMSMNKDHIDKLYKKILDNNITIVKKVDNFVHKNRTFDTEVKIGDKTNDLSLIKTNSDVKKLLVDYLKIDSSVTQNDLTYFDEIIDSVMTNIGANNFSGQTCKKKIKLLDISFNGMSLYEANNAVNFCKFSKIMGISDTNSAGKSSFIDCILQAIFGKCTRGDRADIINVNKNRYSSKIRIDVNGIIYAIERTANRNSRNIKQKKTNEVVTFYENDKNISCKKIDETRTLIEEKLCSYSDFLLTSIVTQKTSYGFAELSDHDKRDFLCKISKLDIFDKILNSANTTYKSTAQEIGKKTKLFEKYKTFGTTNSEIKSNIETKLAELSNDIKTKQTKLAEHVFKRTEIAQELVKIKVGLENIDNAVKNVKLESLKSLLKTTQTSVKTLTQTKTNITEKIHDLQTKINEYGDIQKYKENFEKKQLKKINELKQNLTEIRHDVSFINADVDFDNVSEDALLQDIETAKSSVEALQTSISELHALIDSNEALLKKTKRPNKKFVDRYVQTVADVTRLQTQIDATRSEIEKLKQHVNKDYQYDPNCKYCMQHDETQDKLRTEVAIDKLTGELDIAVQDLANKNRYVKCNSTKYDAQQQNIKRFEQLNKIIIQNNLLKKDIEIKSSQKYNSDQILKQKEQLYEKYIKTIPNKNVVEMMHKLENQMETILTQTCDKYTDCMQLQQTLTTEKTELANITNEINILEKKSRDITTRLALADELLLLHSKQGEIDTIINTLQTENERQTDELIQLKISHEHFKSIYENIQELEKRKQFLAKLIKILSNNGIVDNVISKKILPHFNTISNELFSKFGSRKVVMEYDNSKINIYDENGVNTIMDGGYQTYLNNLVYRIALSQVNSYISANFMIIDELFDSSDNTNMNNIKNFIKYIGNMFDWLLIISHNDDIKDIYDNVVLIQTIGNNGRKLEYI